MPTYEYKCEKCGFEFERFQSISAGALRKCPKCGRSGLKRLIGVGAGIIFKGSGFYETDYRSESYKKGKENDKGPSSTAGTTDKKTDTKAHDTKTSKKGKTAGKDQKKSA